MYTEYFSELSNCVCYIVLLRTAVAVAAETPGVNVSKTRFENTENYLLYSSDRNSNFIIFYF